MRLDQFILQIERLLLFVAMVVMLGSTTLVILSRYIEGLSLGFLSDLAVGLIPWVGLLGAAVALRQGRHIGMTLLRDILPERFRSTLVLLSQIVILAFLAILLVAGASLVARQLESGVTTSAMEFPRFLITLSLPVGAALAIIHQVVEIIDGIATQHAYNGHDNNVRRHRPSNHHR